MQHYDAVNTLSRILPELLKGDVSTNLVKVASRNRWAPEVLRKVANVYNMARQLAIYDSDDRGGRPDLIEPAEVVNSYLKVASVAAEPAIAFRETWGLPANGTQMKVAADSTPVEASRAQNFWSNTGLPQVEVSAGPVASSPLEMKRAFHENLACYREVRQIGYNEATHSLDLLRKVAHAIASSADPQGMFTRVAIDTSGVLHAPLVDTWTQKLAQACGDLGINCSHYDKSAAEKVVVARDFTGHAATLKEAADALALSEGADRVRHEYLTKAAAIAFEHGAVIGTDGNLAMRRIMFEEFPGLMPGHDKEASDATDAWLAQLDKLAAANPKQRDNVVAFPGGGNPAPAQEGEPQPRERKEPGFAEGFGHVVDSGLGIGRKAYAEAKEFLGNKVEGNRAAVESQENERFRVLRLTRAAANLQRLMHVDEVIREKPPERITSAFNTILGASPEVASDPELLRLLLRQALETQGVDIESAGTARKFEYGAFRKDMPIPR